MKILMVNKFLYPVGGAETYMLKLGDYLTKNGHDIQYFGMYDKRNIVGNKSNSYTSNMDFRNGNAISKITYPFKTIYSFESVKKIRIVLEEFKPDIVHMNNINFQLTPAIIYEIKKHNIPIVQTVHDVQIACPCHRFYIEHKQQVCKQCKNGKYLQCVKNKCVQNSIAKSIVAFFESVYYHKKNTYNEVDCYICPSKFVAKEISEAGVENSRIKIMYNYSDKIEQLNSNYKKKYALFFGRFSVEKGIRTLLQVCEKLSNVNFVIAGSGALTDEVESTSKRLSNVEYVGFITGKELQQMITDASFSIYPSEWYENCPLSVIESMALGTPVIGSDLGGTKELITDGKDGLIFKAGNQQLLSEAIIKLWTDAELLNKMSAICKKTKIMDIKMYTEELIKIYIKLIMETVQKLAKFLGIWYNKGNKSNGGEKEWHTRKQ